MSLAGEVAQLLDRLSWHSLHVRGMTRVEIDTHRQVFADECQRVPKLLLAHLSSGGVAELLLDLLLALGIEVG
jgi:hypothetical protein